MANDKTLYLNKVFPDSNFLQIEYKPYEKMKDTCIFVLDTNALLSPYRASSKSFDDIKSIYTKLKTADRLRIPFRALQEYAKNRGNSLQEQYTHFDKMNSSDTMRKIETDLQVIPLLQTNQHFVKFHEITNKINELMQVRAETISAILSDIKELYWKQQRSDLLCSGRKKTQNRKLELFCRNLSLRKLRISRKANILKAYSMHRGCGRRLVQRQLV